VGVVAISKDTTASLTLAIFYPQGNYQVMTLRPCPLVLSLPCPYSARTNGEIFNSPRGRWSRRSELIVSRARR
jgi:hypothetical protein